MTVRTLQLLDGMAIPIVIDKLFPIYATRLLSNWDLNASSSLKLSHNTAPPQHDG